MIRLLVMDVDGTLTDGKIYMGPLGEVFKAFDVKDGCGIKEILPKHGIVPVIITARNSEILQNRCRELGITELYQGIRRKIDCLNNVVGKYKATIADVAYIGDDILDLQCMIPVVQGGGIAACPADAADIVVSACTYVSPYKAGEGAVRDFIEQIVSGKFSSSTTLDLRLPKAIGFVNSAEAANLIPGRYDISSDFYVIVMEYTSKHENDVHFESHRKYIDIQRVLSGEERLMIADISRLTPIAPYNEREDLINYAVHGNQSFVQMCPGTCVVLFPKDAHRAVCLGSKNTVVKKIVGKLMIDYA